MNMIIFSGRANRVLAEAIAAELGVELGRCRVENFPDDEYQVEIEQETMDREVFLVQPTGPPVAGHLMELLLLADACRRAGAARVSALIPYFGYARQERREHGREPVGARLAADLLSTRIDRVVFVDLHAPAIEGFFIIPVEHLSAVSLLAEAVRPLITAEHIIVAPDLGAVKLAERYAVLLGIPVAYIHKIRESGKEVSVHRVIGEVKNKKPLVVDDMISTGGTVVSAIEALLENGCRPEVVVSATHGLLVGDAKSRLAALPIRRIVVTDSLQISRQQEVPLEVVSLKKMLAQTVGRLCSRAFC